mmetsp:Transcript_9534/g.28440  ORF Transcript_9534/g.28440 Transcript_9534/m.28440 type:complete len:377 (-) Transcript_9534:338-1468(-)
MNYCLFLAQLEIRLDASQYGGTYQGERKLATKLAKKYGTVVRLLVVTEESSSGLGRGVDIASSNTENQQKAVRDESWYRLRPTESGSGVVDFLSSEFDPVAALSNPSTEDIARANPWMSGLLPNTILDNIGKCATLLPDDDPLRKESHHQLQLRKIAVLKPSATHQITTAEPPQKRPRRNQVDLHPFEAIASHLDSGPHSLLFRLRRDRKRIKVVVRYVNMIRGTITGFLVAFDKHMNLILKDVEEVYSPRLANERCELSNLDLELERRRRVSLAGDRAKDLDNGLGHQLLIDGDDVGIDANEHHRLQQHREYEPGNWHLRRRQMKQLLVRGDMVVSIYEAAQEKMKLQLSRHRKRTPVATTQNQKKQNETLNRGA